MQPELGLQVSLGSIELTLQELADLQRGELLRLSWSPGQTVMIYLGEHRIAEARLLSDGEGIFAEIVRVYE